MSYNFEQAIQLGINSSITREKSIQEIDKLLIAVNESLLKSTKDKLEIAWREKAYNSLLTGISSLGFPVTNVKIESIPKEERVIFVRTKIDPSKYHDLTVLTIDSNGFPCEMNVNGNKHIAHDIESLADGFSILFSTAFFGQKVRNLIDQGA